MTKAEAAELAGVSIHTVSSWIARGHLAPVRPHAKPALFREDDVIRCAHDRMSRAEHHALDALWNDVLARSD